MAREKYDRRHVGILAIFFQEPGYEEVALRITQAGEVGIGAPTLVECGIVLSARLERDAR